MRYIQIVLAAAALAGTAQVQAQQPTRSSTFEVASVKPNVDGPGKMQTVTRPGGVFVAVNTPLRLLIADAYIGNQPGAIDRIVGGPDWVQSARYDITAKAAREFRPTPPGPPAEMLLMLRALLEDLGGSSPSLSPDGRFVAVSRLGNGFGGVSVLDTATGAFSWVNAFRSNNPLWSLSGDDLVYSLINKTPSADLFVKPVASEGIGRPLLETGANKTANDWSRDGRYLLYRNNDPNTRFDIMALPFDTSGRPGKPFPVVQTSAEEREAQFSPDAAWIAYQSNRSGSYEIYLQRFPDPASASAVARSSRPVLLSRGGGTQVRWRRDGKELFYIAPDGMLMAVPMRFDSSGPVPGTPVRLFASRVNPASQTTGRQEYIVAEDGKKFLISIPAETTSAISLIQHWKPEP